MNRHRTNIADHLCLALGAFLILIATAAAIPHLTDRFMHDHVSGAWMALADEALRANPYPPLFDEQRSGGTRFMPLPIALHALLAATLDATLLPRPLALLTAGKLLSLLSTLAIVVVLARIGRRLHAPLGLSLLLAATLPLTGPGLQSLTAGRHDAPALLLQLLALLTLLNRTPTTPRLITAATLCTLGVFAKSSTAWMPLGLTIALAIQHPRALRAFIPAGIASALAAAAITHLWTHARAWDNILTLTFSGSQDEARSLLDAAKLAARSTIETSSVILWLAPLGIPALLRPKHAALWLIPAALSALVTLIVFRDAGVTANHLLEPVTMLLVATLAGAARPQTSHESDSSAPIPSDSRSHNRSHIWSHIGAPIWALTVIATAFFFRPLPRIAWEAHTAGPTPAGIDATAWQARFSPDARILSEDPAVPILAGHRADLLDPFMLLRMGEPGEHAQAHFAEQISAGRYDAVILLRPLENPYTPGWYQHTHLGQRITTALQLNYRFEAQLGDRVIYTPDN